MNIDFFGGQVSPNTFTSTNSLKTQHLLTKIVDKHTLPGLVLQDQNKGVGYTLLTRTFGVLVIGGLPIRKWVSVA